MCRWPLTKNEIIKICFVKTNARRSRRIFGWSFISYAKMYLFGCPFRRDRRTSMLHLCWNVHVINIHYYFTLRLYFIIIHGRLWPMLRCSVSTPCHVWSIHFCHFFGGILELKKRLFGSIIFLPSNHAAGLRCEAKCATKVIME